MAKGENCVGAFSFKEVFDDLSYLLQYIVSTNTIPALKGIKSFQISLQCLWSALHEKAICSSHIEACAFL